MMPSGNQVEIEPLTKIQMGWLVLSNVPGLIFKDIIL